MTLTSEAVVRLARPARFDLSAEEIERFRGELMRKAKGRIDHRAARAALARVTQSGE